MNSAKKLNVDYHWPLKKVALANGQLEFIVRMISYKKHKPFDCFILTRMKIKTFFLYANLGRLKIKPLLHKDPSHSFYPTIKHQLHFNKNEI
jgi:hypothetical protein